MWQDFADFHKFKMKYRLNTVCNFYLKKDRISMFLLLSLSRSQSRSLMSLCQNFNYFLEW